MPGVLLTIGWIALFLFAIRRSSFFNAPGLSKRTIGSLFLLKIVAGTAMWWIYTFHFPDRANADIYKYFDDGNIMFSALPDHPLDYLSMLFGIHNDQAHFDGEYYRVMHNWYRQYESNMYNDAHTMIRFNAFVRIFSFGVYHMHTVFACFFGIIGSVALYRTFVTFLAGHERALTIAIFLLPSVLFWGSGVIKEALLFFGLGLFLFNVFGMLRDGARPLRVLTLVFCCVLLFFLKFYVLLSLIPALIAYVWCRRTKDRSALLKYAVTYAVCIIIALNSSHIIPRFDIIDVLWVKQKDFIGMATAAHAGSLVDVVRLERNAWSFVKRSPHALYMTFLSPITAWRNGVLGLVSATENIALIGSIAFFLTRRRPWRDVDKPLFYLCIGYCVLLALVIGWTTPVIGALVRYRTPLLPFLLIAVLLIADPNRVKWPRWMHIK